MVGNSKDGNCINIDMKEILLIDRPDSYVS
jgi:hypothetical protein